MPVPPTEPPGRDEGAPSTKASRWWLDTAIARIAFGRSTPPPMDECMPLRTPHAALASPASSRPGPDLSDADQRDLGDYQLIAEIGRGGMGLVYKARQLSLQRDVAIKLLDTGIWASPELIAGLYHEARHAARLQHPNIVAVYGVGETHEQVYLAMQYIDGHSLSERIERDGPLPILEAVRMVRATADAVDYAHRLGILHLDLKPGNLLIDSEGNPHVTDFGLARRVDASDGVENDCISGTPSYMAPEQVQLEGPRLSRATDVWGLGTILYETLTGRPPFVGDTPEAVIRDVASTTVCSPRTLRPMPRDLEAIVMRCLRRMPSQRYARARDLADDLSRFLDGRPVQARPLNAMQRLARWIRLKPRDAAMAGLALLALLAACVLLVRA